MSDAPLPYERVGQDVVPVWLTPRQRADVEAMIDEYQAAAGHPRHRLDARLRSMPRATLSDGAAGLLTRVMDESVRSRPPKRPSARQVRAELYLAAARLGDRDTALAQAIDRHAMSAADIERRMFADVPPERIVAELDAPPDPSEVIERTNLLLVQRLLRRARSLSIHFQGNARAIARALRATRLLAEIEDGTDSPSCRASLSGPLSLHHHTTMYGHALARFVPALAWCRRWELTAELSLADGPGVLRCSQRDPILGRTSARPRFDSKVEQRFHRDFLRLHSPWELHREPAPVRSGNGWIFPDFYASRDGSREPGVWIEIVGFWTPDYLRHKLQRIAATRVRRWLLCVDESLAVDEGSLPATATLLPYRRSVDAAMVAQRLEALPRS